jgi:hypothetical protein
VVAVYVYRDERGKPLYEVHRHQPKGFWVHGPLRRKVLYRLPELLAADPERPVFVVEGEKDVEACLAQGLVATCNPLGGGASKWLPQYGRHLRGRDVVILPDNDTTGHSHANGVARSLHRVARSVRILELPGLRPKGDVSDWFDAGGKPAQLLEMAAGTAVTPPPAPDLDARFEDYSDLVSACKRVLRVLADPGLATAEKLLLVALTIPMEPEPRVADLARYVGVGDCRTKQLLAGLLRRDRLRQSKRGRTSHYKVAHPWP